MVRIIIGGDICPMGRIQDAFIGGYADEIFHDLLPEILDADLTVANLECPLVSEETPIEKAAVLGADTKCIQGFSSAKWHVLNLANNHSFDHGEKGLRETIHAIERSGLTALGAGETIAHAKKPFIKEVNGERIVIYSMAEREFSVADEETPGANPFDLINCINAIRQYKKAGTFVTLIHGGKEFYPYPSPEMVRRGRFLIDMGADAVICCHTHCPLPWEIYNGRPIVYGLGNLIFEPLKKYPASWHEGYMASLLIENGHVSLKTIPYTQSNGNPGARKMSNDDRKRFFDEMNMKSAHVKDSSFISDQWLKYCRQQKESYLTVLFGYNRIMRKASKILLRFLHPKREMHQALLLAQCETHQEVLNTIFREERRL